LVGGALILGVAPPRGSLEEFEILSQPAHELSPEQDPSNGGTAVRLRVENGGLVTRGRVEVARRREWNTRAVRVLNVGVAGLGLILIAPLMAIIAVLVKLSSPGPVLYNQPRVGIDRRRGRATAEEVSRRSRDFGGRIFKIYKFRTMRQDQGGAPQVWASATDPRITRVGAVLRRYRLDELPQLWNVLLGDMNIVGPRPEQPEIFEDLRTQVTAYQKRQRVLPGITGLAQVSHPYDQCLEDVRQKVRYDLEYIHRRSLSEDLRIMARTIPVMVGKKGAL
jgi:lipopolysaccharide/colanic/teichoic acid biosynthesis glycosyltransferase